MHLNFSSNLGADDSFEKRFRRAYSRSLGGGGTKIADTKLKALLIDERNCKRRWPGVEGVFTDLIFSPCQRGAPLRPGQCPLALFRNPFG